MNIPDYLRRFDIPDVAAISQMKRLASFESVDYLFATAFDQWVRHPVLFRPTVRMVEAMGHTDVTLAPSEYRQSYPAILIAHPDGSLSLLAVVTTPQIGKLLFVQHSIHINDTKGGQYAFLISLEGHGRLPDGRHASTIEDAIRAHNPDLPPEQVQEHPLNRVAINLALLLASHPTYRVRTERQKHLEKTAKGHDRGKAIAAREKLKVRPQIIDFVNPPKEYDEFGTPTGITKRPHWRRGHWRRQACGPAWTQHRLIFVRPMLVHREYAEPTTNTIEFRGKDGTEASGGASAA